MEREALQSCSPTMSKRQTCCRKFIVLVLSTLHFFCCTYAKSRSYGTLKQGDKLKFHDQMYSPDHYTSLKFFKDEATNKSYLGISCDLLVGIYDSVDDGFESWSNMLWVANGDSPIVDDSGVLTIDKNGTLMVTHSAGNPVILYSDDSRAGRTRVVTLHDNGNLVFSELNSNGSTEKILWQSFDHPTDTLLPAMKLGALYNISGNRFKLTSRLTKHNPSSGAFTLDWDPVEHQMIIRRRGVIFWTSGVLKDGIFQYIPREVMLKLNCTPVVRKDENSLSYYSNQRIYWKLSEEGTLYFVGTTLRESEQTLVLSVAPMDDCYGYNKGNGCVQWSQPKCRADMPKFEIQRGLFRRIDTNKTDKGVHYANASIGAADCRVICWEDCDCIAYQTAPNSGCQFWKENSKLRLHSSEHESELYVISKSPIFSQSPPNPPKLFDQGDSEGNDIKSKEGRKPWIKIALILVASFGLPCLIVLICGWRWRRRGKRDAADVERQKKYMSEYTKVSISMEKDELGSNLKVFDLKSLSEATNQFSQENKLGEGGFGPVYKGVLPEGTEIAVKRLSRSSGQGLEEFKNELKLIANLQHVNLVRLLGCCIGGEEKMLIYEYMPNKSLDSFLFDPSKRCLLESTTRLKIIEGIAQGLLYLHDHSRLMIIHRDLKASNILLDAYLNPKISDFGMAKIFKRSELMANTERIVGTYGYMSPEYAMEGIFSVKSDVFSLGILILEIVSGRRNNSFNDSDRHINLIGYAWELWQNETWIELVDPALKVSCSMSQLRRIIHIALLCVEESAANRPSVSEVISMLANENTSLPSVKRPAFLIWCTATNKAHYSINDLSLSSIVARMKWTRQNKNTEPLLHRVVA